LNSIYAYLLMCTHFAGTSAVAERDGHCVGFLSAYVKPDSATDLFVWQVAVASDARGQGLARQMIQHVLGRSGAHPLRFVEATVTPDNQASRGLFQALAAAHGAALSESLAFSQDDFGQTDHAVEHLLRIGPFSPSRHTHS
jgi:L-2,4-diaminobutyric acid acetyltransferase